MAVKELKKKANCSCGKHCPPCLECGKPQCECECPKGVVKGEEKDIDYWCP